MRSTLDRAASRLNELLVRASLTLLGDDGMPLPTPRLATGVGAFDSLLDGGLPKGRLVEISGPAGSGKTALALAMIAGVQRGGGTAAFVDAEATLDATRAANAGVDLARLAAARPRSGEEGLQLVDALLKARAADLVVVDSVAALVPRAELIAPLGETPAGLHARLMSQGLRRLVARAASAGSVVVFLNQQRTTFDDEGKAVTTTTGGNALHCYASTRLDVKRRGSGADGALLVRVTKDRGGGAERVAEVRLDDLRANAL